MTMSEYSNSIYADYGKIARGMKMYFKISQPAMYATIKLIQLRRRRILMNLKRRLNWIM